MFHPLCVKTGPFTLLMKGRLFSASFFYFPFVALYDEINSVSFLFGYFRNLAVALYDRIIWKAERFPYFYYMRISAFVKA